VRAHITDFVILTPLFMISRCFHLFLWIPVTIWRYFLCLVRFFLHPPPLCFYQQTYYISNVTGTTINQVHIILHTCFWNQLREGRKRNMYFSVFYSYIITFTNVVCWCGFKLLSGVTCLQSKEFPLLFLFSQFSLENNQA
jgi:hypothetical protein